MQGIVPAKAALQGSAVDVASVERMANDTVLRLARDDLTAHWALARGACDGPGSGALERAVMRGSAAVASRILAASAHVYASHPYAGEGEVIRRIVRQLLAMGLRGVPLSFAYNLCIPALLLARRWFQRLLEASRSL